MLSSTSDLLQCSPTPSSQLTIFSQSVKKFDKLHQRHVILISIKEITSVIDMDLIPQIMIFSWQNDENQ